MALRVVIILRMTATMMTLGFLPAAARRLWNVLKAGDARTLLEGVKRAGLVQAGSALEPSRQS